MQVVWANLKQACSQKEQPDNASEAPGGTWFVLTFDLLENLYHSIQVYFVKLQLRERGTA
jgi:hypothetical protein